MGPPIDEEVFPGDLVTQIDSVKGVTVIGPGLKRNENQPNCLQVTRAGKLRFKRPNTYWIDSVQKRYIPKKGDLVVGIVHKKAGDSLKVDIGSAEPASLSMLAFEGATKKQKPDVQIGDIIYGKLLNAHKEMEPELVCVDSYFKAGKLGLLSNDGFVFNLSLKVVHRLLNVENPLLRTLAKKFPYEICIGMNGKVWVNAVQVRHIMTLIGALESAEFESDNNILEICRQIK